MAGQRPLLHQRGCIPLRRWQRVIVADQHHVGRRQRTLNLRRIEQRIVTAERLAKLAQILAPVVRILRPDFPLHSRQRVQLHRAAPRSKICRGRHRLRLAASF